MVLVEISGSVIICRSSTLELEVDCMRAGLEKRGVKEGDTPTGS